MKSLKKEPRLVIVHQVQAEQISHDRFLRLSAVMDYVGLSHCTIYRKIREGSFPAQIKIGALSVWSEKEVIAWMDEKKLGSRRDD